VVEPASSASRGGDSPERFGNTDDDVILREDERGQRREAQRVAEAEARAAERRAAYTKINNQLRAARNTKQLLHIAKAAVKQGYLVESTSPKGTQGPLAGRFAAAKGFQSAGIYERLAEADESVSSYHQLRNWLMGLKSSELGTDIIQRRQLEQLIGNISRDSFSGHEIPLTGARVRAMLGTNTPPSHAILEAIQKQLIAGHHAGDKYVPPSQKARGDVTYKHGRAVQLVPLDKAGLDALEAIDKRLGRKRKKREIVEWAVDPAENKRFLASQPKPAYS
jgi:hypothetical protein